MKSVFNLLLVFLLSCSNVFAGTFTSVGTGNWDSGSTWNQGGSIPVSTDDVIIADGHVITVNSTVSCDDLFINNGGTLEITVGGSLSSARNVVVEGTLSVLAGTLNSGDSKSDTFTISGGVLNFSGGTINISGRFRMYLADSQCNISGAGNLNISTAGQQTVSSYNNFGVSNGAFTVDASTTGMIILKNGNSTEKEEVYYSPHTSNFSGGSLVIENGTELSEILVDSDMPLYKLNSDVGAGKKLQLTSDCNFSLVDLSIVSGFIHIDVGAEIDVTGSIITNDSLIIESNQSGNGSLVSTGSVSGNIVFKRYIEQYSGNNDGWHEISSPVNNMSINGSTFDPGPNDDLFLWSEASNIWLNHKDETNNVSSLNNGTGYLVSYETTEAHEFQGALNSSDVIFNNLSQGAGSGWHLLGNPFTSAISWGTGSWNMINIGGVAKVFNEATGNYSDLSTGDVIPATNGFFIQVSSSTNSITIPVSEQIHSSINNYKSDTVEARNKIDVTVYSHQNSYSDKTILGLCTDATYNWDPANDSRKLAGIQQAPQLYTKVGDEEYSTNFIPILTDVYEISLCFKAGMSGMFTMVLNSSDSLLNNYDIVLNDNRTGTHREINNNLEFSFTAQEEDAFDRFSLLFNPVNTIEVQCSGPIDLFSSGNTIKILNKTDESNYGTLLIFDLAGRTSFHDKVLVYPGKTNLGSLDSGIYIVRYSSDRYHITKKIVIH